MDRINLRTLLFLIIQMSVSINIFGAEPIRITGRALFSFTEDYFVIQTEKYIFKLKKSAFTSDLKNALSHASRENLVIDIMAPQNSIDYLWPNKPYKDQTKQGKILNETVRLLKAEAGKNKGKIRIAGRSLYSFEESLALFQIGDSVYQVKKSQLAKTELKAISDANIGSRIELTVPQDAIQMAWGFKQETGRHPANIKDSDEISFQGPHVKIRGTVLYSFSEPFLLIQSQGTIYQLRNVKMDRRFMDANQNPGSRVSVEVPLADVQFAWIVDPDDIKFERTPANHP